MDVNQIAKRIVNQATENTPPGAPTVGWSVQAAMTVEDLMTILYIASCGLKTQAIASPVLADPKLMLLRDRISAIADELNGIQFDVALSTQGVARRD